MGRVTTRPRETHRSSVTNSIDSAFSDPRVDRPVAAVAVLLEHRHERLVELEVQLVADEQLDLERVAVLARARERRRVLAHLRHQGDLLASWRASRGPRSCAARPAGTASSGIVPMPSTIARPFAGSGCLRLRLAREHRGDRVIADRPLQRDDPRGVGDRGGHRAGLVAPADLPLVFVRSHHRSDATRALGARRAKSGTPAQVRGRVPDCPRARGADNRLRYERGDGARRRAAAGRRELAGRRPRAGGEGAGDVRPGRSRGGGRPAFRGRPRRLAEHLGYPAALLDRIPAEAVASYAGVGYHLDLASLGRRRGRARSRLRVRDRRVLLRRSRSGAPASPSASTSRASRSPRRSACATATGSPRRASSRGGSTSSRSTTARSTP